MKLLKLQYHGKDYVWGGTKLSTEYHKGRAGEKLAETWELSCHPDGPSTILNGEYAGSPLSEFIEKEGKEVLGSGCEGYEEFPILIKFIDAQQDLSIQVHPDDTYALQHEGQFGKTELWYVVDCEEDAYLYYGLKEDMTIDELAKRIRENTLLEALNKVSIQPGDVFFIQAGTIHAIGRNTLIAEIQQNSNVTYRIHDFGRKDRNGQERELHVEKALDVADLHKAKSFKGQGSSLASCNYFVVDKIVLEKEKKEETIVLTKKSFVSLLVLTGAGQIVVEEEAQDFTKGDSFFVPAGHGSCKVKGEGVLLVTKVPA